MSRVGKLPVPIPKDVDVQLKDGLMTVKGPKGELTRKLHPEVLVTVEEEQIVVKRPSESKEHRSLHGLTRALIANMVDGVYTGFQKKLEIVGVGYRAEMKKRGLLLTLGYSHQILFTPPEGVEITVEKDNSITVSGIDRELVGQVAAKIRSFRKPEPYKGKGIRYSDETIRRKAGKTAA